MWVELPSCVGSGRHARTHLEERVHLLLCAYLVAEDTVGAQVGRLMQIRARGYPEATDDLPISHDAATLALEGRGLVDGPTERVLPLAWIGATNDLLGRLYDPAQRTRLDWLHLILLLQTRMRRWFRAALSLIIF